jgi:class 3 adenylate cyclase/CHASE2 domain-containing sensor protein
VKLKPLKLVPALIALSVIILICGARLLEHDFVERLERMTYDMRVRQALHFKTPVATNLAFVEINDASIVAVHDGSLGFHYGLYWPRQVYGRLVQELSAQGAKATAFDIIFGERRFDHPQVQLSDDRLMESDEFFALEMRRASNVLIAVTKDVSPPLLFATNALALGDISTDKDSDGILRRVKAFRTYRKWHFAFRQAEADPEIGIDLRKARIEAKQIILPRANGEKIPVPLDDNGDFDLTGFTDKLPPGVAPKAKPFTEERVWHMGIVLAAQELGLDLSKAEVDLPHGRIVLRGKNNERIIPVDADGYFYIDWCLPPNDPRLTQEPIQNLLMQNRMRLEGRTNGLVNHFAGKLIVVGSSATGNDLTDRGATPLERDTLFVSKHWNVANTILTGRFIHRSSVATELLLITLMGIIAALLTWRLRVLVASGAVIILAALYVFIAFSVYAQYRYWMPVVLPVLGAFLITHVCLVTWQVVFERADKRRVRSVFSRIVSPNIVNELLGAETLSLGGARRQITVFFADVRGFTEFTDATQEKAVAYVREHNLNDAETEEYFNEQARETLSTVNSYLALVADMVKKHDGTLDKYIGDCVMAFWGAPTPNQRHALCCVRAAIDAQRAVYDLNKLRDDENKGRELENMARISAGLTPKPFLPILLLGTGINTGMATVGLMGSEAHISNYTVFGRDVNLASRLETLSGRGRILISQATYELLKRDDAALAATCVALPDANLKGIRSAVKVYEVPWQPEGFAPFDTEFTTSIAADRAASTNFIKREDV